MSRLQWEKAKIDPGAFESATVLDVNNNGVLDILCGGWWYEGPGFKTRHKVCDLEQQNEYYNDFGSIPLDVNGDGNVDVVTGGWFNKSIVWRENPGAAGGDWTTHVIDEGANCEVAWAWDIDGCGTPEIIPNTPGAPLRFYKLMRDAKGKANGQFKRVQLGPDDKKSGHGLGVGDINGNGRQDIVVFNGWWEAPEDAMTGEWVFHQEFEIAKASIPMLVADVDGDGLNDLIVGCGHGYGLDWYKQSIGADGKREWTRHPIDPFFAQYHCLIWADIDGDGVCEIVTGNRHRAHNGNDIGSTNEVGVYYFKWTGEGFSKVIVDHGFKPDASGVGLSFTLADLNGDGRLDIVAPGKEGLYLFRNLGPVPDPPPKKPRPRPKAKK